MLECLAFKSTKHRDSLRLMKEVREGWGGGPIVGAAAAESPWVAGDEAVEPRAGWRLSGASPQSPNPQQELA
jgi:hypothetical protein